MQEALRNSENGLNLDVVSCAEIETTDEMESFSCEDKIKTEKNMIQNDKNDFS